MATKRKVRRFATGEFIDNESESGEWAGDENYGDGTTREERVAMAKAPARKSSLTEDETAVESNIGQGKYAAPAKSAPAKQTFKEAFAAARGAKKGSFDWNGTKYTTEMAGEKKSAAPTGGSGRGGQGGPTAEQNASRYKSDTAGAGRGGQGGPTADELDAYAKSKKRPDIKGLMPSGENIQKGLEIAAGAPGLKAVASAAKGLANRAPAAAEKLREYIQPVLSGPTKRLAGPGAKEAVTDVAPKALSGPTRALPAPAKAAPAKETSAARSARRDAEGYSPDEALKALKKTNKKPKKSLDESDTSGGAIGYKKGGNVKGWGIARGARKAKIV